MSVKHKIEVDDLKKSIEILTAKMSSLSDQSVGEKGKLGNLCVYINMYICISIQM